MTSNYYLLLSSRVHACCHAMCGVTMDHRWRQIRERWKLAWPVALGTSRPGMIRICEGLSKHVGAHGSIARAWQGAWHTSLPCCTWPVSM